MKTKIVTITPALASKLLASNTHNRDVRVHHVNLLAAEMLTGRFVSNGDTIKRATDGTILDGQHRLLACIQSGVSFEAILVEELDPSVQSTIDVGAPRSMADILKLQRGFVNVTSLAADTTATWYYQANDGLQNTQYLAERRSASRTELLAWFDRHRDALVLAEGLAAQIAKSAAKLPTRSTAIALFAGATWDPEVTELFANNVATGDAPLDDSARQLREYGIRRSQARDKAMPPHVAVLTIRSWNRWVRGETVSKVMPNRATTTRTAVEDDAGRVIFPFATGAARP